MFRFTSLFICPFVSLQKSKFKSKAKMYGRDKLVEIYVVTSSATTLASLLLTIGYGETLHFDRIASSMERVFSCVLCSYSCKLLSKNPFSTFPHLKAKMCFLIFK